MKVINNINILRNIAAAGEPELEHSASSEASSELASASLSAAEALKRIPYARKAPYGFIMSLGFAASLAVSIGGYTAKTINYLANDLANLKLCVAELKKRKQRELSKNQATQA